MIKTIYRIEHPVELDGMWYDRHGNPKKRIHELCPDGLAKDFPMPLNLPLHRKDGNIWVSAGKSMENMNQWFTPEDAKSLYSAGFKLFEFTVSEYQELEMEILFRRDEIIKQKEIALNKVWKI